MPCIWQEDHLTHNKRVAWPITDGHFVYNRWSPCPQQEGHQAQNTRITLPRALLPLFPWQAFPVGTLQPRAPHLLEPGARLPATVPTPRWAETTHSSCPPAHCILGKPRHPFSCVPCPLGLCVIDYLTMPIISWPLDLSTLVISSKSPCFRTCHPPPGRGINMPALGILFPPGRRGWGWWAWADPRQTAPGLEGRLCPRGPTVKLCEGRPTGQCWRRPGARSSAHLRYLNGKGS